MATQTVPQTAVIPIPARSSRGHMAFLTTEEMLAVLRAARSRSIRDWAMILVAYRHGMRASEVCGLRRDDLNLRGESITIRRLKGSLETCQPLCGHAGQPLLDELKALRQWMKDRPGDGSDYVFTSQKGGRMHRSQFFRIFQDCEESAGLPRAKWHPHVLKHSLATHLIDGNVNLAVVKKALGHKSIGSTMVYVTVSDRQAGDASRAALMSLY
jgi:site-specific recombinase XerD